MGQFVERYVVSHRKFDVRTCRPRLPDHHLHRILLHLRYQRQHVGRLGILVIRRRVTLQAHQCNLLRAGVVPGLDRLGRLELHAGGRTLLHRFKQALLIVVSAAGSGLSGLLVERIERQFVVEFPLGQVVTLKLGTVEPGGIDLVGERVVGLEVESRRTIEVGEGQVALVAQIPVAETTRNLDVPVQIDDRRIKLVGAVLRSQLPVDPVEATLRHPGSRQHLLQRPKTILLLLDVFVSLFQLGVHVRNLLLQNVGLGTGPERQGREEQQHECGEMGRFHRAIGRLGFHKDKTKCSHSGKIYLSSNRYSEPCPRVFNLFEFINTARTFQVIQLIVSNKRFKPIYNSATSVSE